jgi:hypothetical protein
MANFTTEFLRKAKILNVGGSNLVCVCVCYIYIYIYFLDDPLNLGLYNMIYFSIIKTLKKLTLYNKLKQVSIFIYST